MSGFRLPAGGHINRSKPLSFSFEGKSYQGFEGDTLASALIANGISVIGRSFKYHRPRGLLAAGFDEPNAIVQIGEGAHTIPNLKATGVELYNGLKASPVNVWPRLSFDLMAVNSLFARFIPAGFYYKTFMWPDWRLFEPTIRKAAGLGRSPDTPDPDIYDKRYAECDVLVVGGGPTGLMAALTAARAGARVMLVEQDARWGGSLLAHGAEISDGCGVEWAADVIGELNNIARARLLNRTMAFGYYDHNLVGLVERMTDHLHEDQRCRPRQRFWQVRAGKVILATGAIERPLVFPNNDRPGVMLAGAGAAYAHRFAAAPGKRVVIVTNNDSVYECALSLKAKGVEIVAIADARAAPVGACFDKVDAAGLAVLAGTTITDVYGANGVREAELHKIDDDGKAVFNRNVKLECDAVLTSGGWSPAVHLFSQAGGKLQFDEGLQAFVPAACTQNVVCVGAAAGEFSLAVGLQSAASEGVKAAEAAGRTGSKVTIPDTHDKKFGDIRPMWQVDVSALGKRGKKAWLDFQNDVTVSDVELAIRENFQSVEHVKRYTTLGMASDQGKTSNVNGIGVMEGALGKAIARVGTTKFRPPYDPVTIGAFAGRRIGENLAPLRPLAAEENQIKAGAKFEDYGWRRAAYYTTTGESEKQAVRREVLAVRESVGLFDASPLGKIEVYGPDAAEFLTRIYINNMKTLKPGRCRYGLMLDEHGIVFDDGVLACLGEDHFLVGTTSGHAAAIASALQEWLQCEWTDLNVVTEDVTSAWAVMNVNGPHARAVMQSLNTDISFSKDAFPHMQYRAGKLEGVPCRVQRVSFSGELSYEVSVPWGYGASLWDTLIKAGKSYNITPFGIEALMVLRTEKGFLHVGSDTDGATMPQDLGFGPMIGKKTSDFVGRRSTMRPDALRENRRKLVGLEVIGEGGPLPVGAHVLSIEASPPAATQGWVTSSVYSPTLERPVAMGLIERGIERMGEEVQIWDLGVSRRAKIVKPGGYDPQGERLSV